MRASTRFAEELRGDTPLMSVDEKSKKLADDICGTETNVVAQAKKIWMWVADYADHYSKDVAKLKGTRVLANR